MCQCRASPNYCRSLVVLSFPCNIPDLVFSCRSIECGSLLFCYSFVDPPIFFVSHVSAALRFTFVCCKLNMPYLGESLS